MNLPVKTDYARNLDMAELHSAFGLRASLREMLLGQSAIPGVGAILVLPAARRAGVNKHKVFVVLETHDVERDGRIVDRLSQLADIDYDLVPESSAGMIPDGTTAA